MHEREGGEEEAVDQEESRGDGRNREASIQLNRSRTCWRCCLRSDSQGTEPTIERRGTAHDVDTLGGQRFYQL